MNDSIEVMVFLFLFLDELPAILRGLSIAIL